MGILDFFNTQQNAWDTQQANSPYTPEMRMNAGMQQLGLLGGTLMAAGAPTTNPGQFGQTMGQYAANSGPMMQQSLDQQMQMQDMMAERDREAAMRAYMESPDFGAGMTTEQMEFIRNAPTEIGMGLLGDSLFAQPDLLKSNQTGTFKTPTGEIVMGTYNDAIAGGWTEYTENDPWAGINIPTGFGPVDPSNPAAGIQPLQGYDPNYGKTPEIPETEWTNFSDGNTIRSLDLGTAEGQAEAAALANAGFYKIGTSINAGTLNDLGGNTVPGPLDSNGDPIDPGKDRYWVPDDSTELGWRQEVIPGTETERELEQSDQASENKRRIAIEKANNVISAIDDSFAIIDDAGWLDPATGFGGAALEDIPGTSAYKLKATTTTIKANLGFDALQAMRDASPTGGALGQVAIQELEALQSALANLDVGQGEEIMRANLQKVRDHYTNLINIINEVPAINGGASLTNNGGGGNYRIENGTLVPVE